MPGKVNYDNSPTESRRRRGPRAALAALVVVAMAGAYVAIGNRAKPPGKVLLISIDTLRADHLGYAGYYRDTSPAIDRLARHSLCYLNAFAQATSTLPSHASLLTSLYPSVHGAEVSRRTPLAEEVTTLAELFQEQGFRTGAFTEGGQLFAVWNLDQGFEVYDVSSGSYSEEEVLDDLEGILDRAGRWIEQHRDERFFCFVHSYVVHMPYWPEAPYDRMFDEGYTGELPFRFGDEVERLNRRRLRPDEPDVRHVKSLYDGEIRYMDEHLGRFLGRLEELGIDDETVVVFTSDHGEELGERGKVGVHAYTLYDELLRVPLLIRVPGQGGRRIDRQVRLIDVAPTLAALMGLDAGQAGFQGRDLLADGPEPAEDWPAFSECVYVGGHWASLRADGWKIIVYPDRRFELFDLAEDPGETVNLYGRDSEVDATWIKRLEYLSAENRIAARDQASPVDLSPEVVQRLRALGYLK